MLKFVINELVGTSIQDAQTVSPKDFIKKLRGWLRELDPAKSNYNVLKKKFSDQLLSAQKNFFDDFFDDASQPIALRVAFALDKDQVFQSRLGVLNREYADDAIKRIKGETDVLKKMFLEKFTGWILGDREDMHDITSLVDVMRQTSVKQSKFFARDQYLRFNKALTIASYETAEVGKVRWLTANDGRVRTSHRKLNGKVFPLDKLPEERHDYNCRCGFIPVFED
jgi:SPP1 gp7 family putative phage head morphogenesis protein